MSLKDRITSVERMRSWTDQIPFHYEYTAGLAGERFLRGLQDGKLLASECSKCGRAYLPPKIYCTECYVEVKRFKAVGPEGVVAARADSSVGFGGEKLPRPREFVYVVFEGVTGGLIHHALGPGVEMGTRVSPRFRPKAKRKGTLLDIEGFEKA